VLTVQKIEMFGGVMAGNGQLYDDWCLALGHGHGCYMGENEIDGFVMCQFWDVYNVTLQQPWNFLSQHCLGE